MTAAPPVPARVPAGPRLPNLVVAGVTKAGTTSLFRYLAQHPDICAADEKELRYFLPLRYGRPLAPLEQYRRHFAASTGQPYAMEASPGYFYGGRALAEAVDATLPDVRVVLSLREPAERCYSFFKFMKSRAQLPQDADFDGYLARCLELHAQGLDQLPEHHTFSGLGAGCYDVWVGAWLEVFGDRLRVEVFEHLAADPAATVAALCGWLGLDPGVTAAFDYPHENRSTQFRSAGVQRAALRVNRALTLWFERHQGAKRAVRRAYYLVNRAPTTGGPSPDARRRMAAFYAPHDARLAGLLAGRTAAPVPLLF